MRLLRRILITVAGTLAVALIGLNWIVPVVLSFYAAKKAPPVTRVVPIDLKDHSVSLIPGQTLSYFGYEFEVPWSDLDESQTKFYPTSTSEKTKVDLQFRSGLRLLFSVIPPRTWAKQLAANSNVSQEAIEAVFGHETMKSDYSFINALYEFTPDKMNHWGLQRGLSRDEFLLIIKSLALPQSAEAGIFKVRSQTSQGFQYGNPQFRKDNVVFDLYSDEDSVEMILFQKNYRNSAGVTQPEINRIVQSLRRKRLEEPAASAIANR